MAIVFLVLSIILCAITLNVWRNQNYKELKSNLVMLALGYITFNAILGLLLLFNVLESNSDSLIHELAQHPVNLIIMIICVANGLFYSVFTLLFLTWSYPIKRS